MNRKTITTVILLLVLAGTAAACGDARGKPPVISFDTGVPGLVVADISKPAGSVVAPPANPVREGYRFDGWTLGGEPYTIARMPDESITLKAAWSKRYAVTYLTGEDASTVPPFYGYKGDEIPAPLPPERPHYKFDGWTLNTPPYNAPPALCRTATWSLRPTGSPRARFRSIRARPISR